MARELNLNPQIPVLHRVLPHLIATHVEHRKQVKSLIQDKAIMPAQFLQYNIKQQVLRLTANIIDSFTNSRFHARQLASLTTFKGCEILKHTRDLAESLQLDLSLQSQFLTFAQTIS
ncbi:hypothetical protein C8J56DRAFT_1044920 [Mycena floridula]|nr:hypothetical protein C8J56DRAFT_1044920 [Mycena floridula]